MFYVIASTVRIENLTIKKNAFIDQVIANTIVKGSVNIYCNWPIVWNENLNLPEWHVADCSVNKEALKNINMFLSMHARK